MPATSGLFGTVSEWFQFALTKSAIRFGPSLFLLLQFPELRALREGQVQLQPGRLRLRQLPGLRNLQRVHQWLRVCRWGAILECEHEDSAILSLCLVVCLVHCRLAGRMPGLS